MISKSFSLFIAVLLIISLSKAQAQSPAGARQVETFVERAEREGTALRMSLRDCMKMALQSNLNIAIQDYSEEILRQRIHAAEHVYDPSFVASIGYRSSDRPNTSPFNRALVSNAFSQRVLQWSGGLRQKLPYGGSWSLEYGTQRSTTNSISSLFNPFFSGSFTFSYRQPLIRNFKANPEFRTLKLVRLDDKINDTEFERQVTEIVKQVQDLYWELVFAIKDQEIKKKSLELARIQLENNRRKVEIGTLAPIAITEASAEVARREQEMIASENLINQMQNNLKRALSNDHRSEIWSRSIIPTESPEFREYSASIEESFATALGRRPELRRIEHELEKVEVDYQYYANQKRPRLDFVGSFGTIAAAGGRGPGAALVPPQNFPSDFLGGLGNLNRQLFTAPFRDFSFGIEVEIPLRSQSLDAQLAELGLVKRQIGRQRKDLEQQILVEVRNAIQAIETNRKVVEAAELGYKLAQEQLDGETKKFQAGLSQTFFVLQRQRDLAEAEGRLLRALIDYQKSIDNLHKAMFTTIDQSDIELARSQVQEK